jgi:wyosine [tRNA(Phe)-imidazoG37] synthetase (radical SAM superfamily)
MNIFGPVPSRRLGRSLGINHIPPKICTYSCVYCQLGKTYNKRIARERFYSPDKIVKEVKDRTAEVRERGEEIDYLTFVPDGEPTLDTSLGEEILQLKGDIPTAVISNASLIWREDVQTDLMNADWVSIKIDAVSDGVWRSINKPHKKLRLKKILQGITEFSDRFHGMLATETMLIRGLNDTPEELRKIAEFIVEIDPAKAYLSLPLRPPAEKWVRPPTEGKITAAYQIFTERGIRAEYLIGYEGNAFASTGDIERDLLSITSVHPMRKEAVEKLLAETGERWETVERLITEEKIIETTYRKKKFYMRKLH